MKSSTPLPPSDTRVTRPLASLPKFGYPVLLLGLLPLLAPAQSASEEADDANVLELDPFVITEERQGYQALTSLSATKFNIEIKSVPISVTSLTRDFLDDTYAQTLEDSLRFTAGVTQGASITAEEGGSFYIRGLRSNRSKRNGIIQLYSQDMTNVARVELVKGPMSVLYGQVEPGGIVNYITLDAQPEFRTEVQLKVGTYEHLRFQLNHTGPILKGDRDRKGELLYRLDYSYKEDEGWRDNTEDLRKFYSGLVQYKPFTSTTVELQWDYLDQDSFNTSPLPKVNQRWRDIWVETVASVANPASLRFLGSQDPFTSYTILFPPNSPLPLPSADSSSPRLWDAYAEHWDRKLNLAPVNAFNDVDQHTVSAEVRQRLSEQWFAKFYAVHHDINRESVWGNMWANGISGDVSAGYSWNHWDRYNDDYAYQLEVSGKWEIASLSNETIAGFEYLDNHFESFLAEGGFSKLINPALIDLVANDPTNPYASPTGGFRAVNALEVDLAAPLSPRIDEEKTTQAAYVSNVTRLFGERLLVMGGLRYDEITIDNFGLNNDGEREMTATFSEDALSPQIGASMKLGEGANAYLSYSKSFVPQSGEVEVLKSDAEIAAELSKPPASRSFTNSVSRRPFNGVGVEAGIKYDLFNGHVSGTSSVYRIELSGVTKTYFVTIPGAFDDLGQPQTALIGSQNNGREVEGFETELFIRPREGMQVILSYSFVNSKELLATAVEDIREGAAVTLSIPSVSVPRHQVGLWLKQSFRSGPWKGLSLGGGLSWLDERFGDYTLRSDNPAAGGFVGDSESVENRILLEAQTTFEFFASYELKRGKFTHTFQLNVSNLTNEEFFLPGGNPNDPRRVYFSWKLAL